MDEVPFKPGDRVTPKPGEETTHRRDTTLAPGGVYEVEKAFPTLNHFEGTVRLVGTDFLYRADRFVLVQAAPPASFDRVAFAMEAFGFKSKDELAAFLGVPEIPYSKDKEKSKCDDENSNAT